MSTKEGLGKGKGGLRVGSGRPPTCSCGKCKKCLDRIAKQDPKVKEYYKKLRERKIGMPKFERWFAEHYPKEEISSWQKSMARLILAEGNKNLGAEDILKWMYEYVYLTKRGEIEMMIREEETRG